MVAIRNRRANMSLTFNKTVYEKWAIVWVSYYFGTYIVKYLPTLSMSLNLKRWSSIIPISDSNFSCPRTSSIGCINMGGSAVYRSSSSFKNSIVASTSKLKKKQKRKQIIITLFSGHNILKKTTYWLDKSNTDNWLKSFA